MRKVVITGLGTVNALGDCVNDTWECIKQGKSGVSKITTFDACNLETQIAAQVGNGFERKAEKILSKRQRKQMTRATRMLLVAAEEAIEDSKVNFSDYDTYKVGVMLGVVSTGYDIFEKQLSDAHMIVKSMANAPSAWLSMKHKIYGPAFSLATACASSAYAISLGHSMIQSRMLDAVIVGGVDTHIEPEYIKGFNQILAMSTRNNSPETASRPFSKSRDGFVIGEGAGVMIIEAEDIARQRGTNIYAELSGTAITSEACDITAPQEGGSGMVMTMKKALKAASVKPEEVEYINAHGTSTYLNDLYETMAIKKCFADKAKDIPVTSTKSMLGHTVGAAGVIEGIVSVLTIRHGIITPTINYLDEDEKLDLDYVPNKARVQNVNVAISNSFGFGGHNATLVFRNPSLQGEL